MTGADGGDPLPGLVRDAATGLYLSRMQAERGRLADAARHGHVRRLTRGVYLLNADDMPRHRLFHAMALAVGRRRPSDVVTGPAAAAIHGLPHLLPDGDVIDVIAPGTAHLECRGAIRRRSRPLGEEDIVVKHGVRVTAPARTVLETALLHGGRSGFCVAEGALRTTMTTTGELDEALRRCGNRRGRPDARRALALAGGRSASIGESLMMWGLHRNAMPLPVQQADIRGDDGTFLGVVDFLWPDRGLVVEFDGMVKTSGVYGDPAEVARRQLARQDGLLNAGLRVWRTGWSDVYSGAVFARLVPLLAERVGRGDDFRGRWAPRPM